MAKAKRNSRKGAYRTVVLGLSLVLFGLAIAVANLEGQVIARTLFFAGSGVAKTDSFSSSTGTLPVPPPRPRANPELTAPTANTLRLGDFIFSDNNQNGVFDAGDAAIEGVVLSLFADADNNDIVDDESAVVATTTGGQYLFSNLAPGNYIVRADLSNFQPGGALFAEGLTGCGTTNPDPDNDVQNDSNCSRIPGGAAYSKAITLANGTEPQQAGEYNSSLDLGFTAGVASNNTLRLGDFIFRDNNQNGVFDAGDTALEGVVLSLFADADNNDIVDDENAVLATTTGGQYLFTDLAPGNYIVRADLSNFQPGGVLFAEGLTGCGTTNPDPDNDIQNDSNCSRIPGGAAYSKAITLANGTEPQQAGEYNSTLDLGFPAGVGSPCSENFDSTATPSLPAGWTSSATGGESPWITSSVSADSGANDAFAQDVATVGNTELISRQYIVPGAGGQISFRNLFNLETGADGMVLEMSINGGPYFDIGAANFVAGGYTGTISSATNALNGRPAWTGLSGGTSSVPTYITSTANIPVTANGQIVRFKWRLSTDAANIASGAAGARVDTITIPCTSPTAGVATVSGRVVTSEGRGLRNAVVTILDQTGTSRTVTTGSMGSFVFNEVRVGKTYVIGVTARRSRYASRILQVFDALENVDFVPIE